MQHGSLLLSRSDFAPEFPGLVELAGLTRQRREVALALADALVSLLPGDPIEAGLTELEDLQAEELTRSRYANLSR